MAFFNKTKKLHSGEETEMSFLDHFDELRKHLFRVALIVTVVTIFVFTQKSFVFDTVIIGPLNKANQTDHKRIVGTIDRPFED